MATPVDNTLARYTWRQKQLLLCLDHLEPNGPYLKRSTGPCVQDVIVLQPWTTQRHMRCVLLLPRAHRLVLARALTSTN